jgi:hypothetical protein
VIPVGSICGFATLGAAGGAGGIAAGALVAGGDLTSRPDKAGVDRVIEI